MGARSTAAMNPMLTNYASGLSQDSASALAKFIAPEVPCPAGRGQFKKFDEANAFKIYETERALGAPSNRMQFQASDGSFDCRPQGLSAGIDDTEYDDAGDSGSADLEQSRIKTLVTAAALSHESKVFTLAKTITAVSNVGVWSTATNSPIKEINDQIKAMAVVCGMLPNRLVFGLGAWAALVEHSLVLSRLKVTEGAVTTQRLAPFLLNPAIEIRVGVLSTDASKFGATSSKSEIVGADVFLFIGQDSPSTYDPSFMKTFVTKRGSVDQVRTFRDESAHSTIHEVAWSEDIKITGTSAVKRITVS